MHRFLHACPAPSSRKPASGEQDSRFSAEKLGPRQETLQQGLRAAPHVAAWTCLARLTPHGRAGASATGQGRAVQGRPGSGGQWRAAGRPRWCRLTHGAPGGGLLGVGDPGPPAGHHSLKLDPASEGERICVQRTGGRTGRGTLQGAPEGGQRTRGMGAMAGRLWQGLGWASQLPHFPTVSPVTPAVTLHTPPQTHSTAKEKEGGPGFGPALGFWPRSQLPPVPSRLPSGTEMPGEPQRPP